MFVFVFFFATEIPLIVWNKRKTNIINLQFFSTALLIDSFILGIFQINYIEIKKITDN